MNSRENYAQTVHQRIFAGMLHRMHNWALHNPIFALTWIALVPRVIAAFFSEGYFAHDDHFLIIEPAASWVQDSAYSTWLPWNQGADPRPSGHSFFYVGLHFLLFKTLAALTITDPKTVMVFVRLVHAFWGLIIVRIGYRIALELTDERIAWRTGLFLALFYFMPFLAVRNLVEVTCIPFLMLGAWQMVRNATTPSEREVFWAGVWIGMAMNIRFQTIFFAIGPGLVLLFMQRWRPALIYGAGVFVPLVIIQGSLDLALWGRPFAEMTEYVMYNLANTTSYFDQPWYNYLLLLGGIFIPFLSVAVLFGAFRRTTPLLLWLPVILFLLFHSYFPNKQERFLLPIVPLFFLIGYTSWEQWRAGSSWWQRHAKLWRANMVFVWILNTILVLILCVSSSKRSRVEALYGLRDHLPIQGILIEDTYGQEAPMPPLFYLGQWNIRVLPWTDPNADLKTTWNGYVTNERPDIVLFFGKEDLQQRQDRVAAVIGPLEPLFEAEPGLLDRVVYWLNPINRNETIVVMRTKK